MALGNTQHTQTTALLPCLPRALIFPSLNSKLAFFVEFQTGAYYLLLSNVKRLDLINMTQKLFIIFRKVLRAC